MAASVMTFSNPLNVSVQIGDTAYYVPTTSSGNFTVNSSAVVEIGIISAIDISNINAPIITVGNSQIANGTINNGFILFSKDNKANLSSLLGYYCETKVKSNSTVEEELFSIAVDTFESSK